MKKIILLTMLSGILALCSFSVSAKMQTRVVLSAEISDIIGGKSISMEHQAEKYDDGIEDTEHAEDIMGFETVVDAAPVHLVSSVKSYIKYTTDGSDPKDGKYYYQSNNLMEYTDDIEITEPGTYHFRAIACIDDIMSEEINTVITIDQLEMPEITPISGEEFETVTMTADKKADIYYTTDGSKPTEKSELYIGSFPVTDTAIVRAIAVAEGSVSSDIASKEIIINTNQDEIKNKNYDYLTFDMFSEEIDGKIKITMVPNDEEAEIFYTTNGKAPDENAKKYTGPFYVNENTTVAAIAVLGNETSNIREMDIMIDDNNRNEIEENEGIEPDDENGNEELPDIVFITSQWAKEEVNEAHGAGLVPYLMVDEDLTEIITREKFAAIAVHLYQNLSGDYFDVVMSRDITDTPFTDCSENSDYSSYIAAAYELGITKGTGQTTFSPQDNISREQLATMLFRVLELAGNEGAYTIDEMFDINSVRKFYDDADISDYAAESVYFMAENGIIKGVDGAHFAPLDNATKEQAILISLRCANLFG